MLKVLFLIHDLGRGGAEKVLVNLVNKMDPTRFDITVMALFAGGEHEKRLLPHIHYQTVFQKTFPGNSRIMTLFSSEQLHRRMIKDKYDIEIAYLEGPSSRIIAGCKSNNTKTVNWIHGEMGSRKNGTVGFRSDIEAEDCYNRFDKTICVSQTVKEDFKNIFQIRHACEVLYNTVDSSHILEKSQEAIEEKFEENIFKLVSVGTLKPVKGFDRLLRIVNKLKGENKRIHLYLLGEGPQRKELEQYIIENELEDTITLLGFQTNPYKYVAKCDLFVCSSYREGFSTAATEALIVGTPVCTVEVSGMKEMLGENNEYGVITENRDEALYQGIKELIETPDLLEHYRLQTAKRRSIFSEEKTVYGVEKLLMELAQEAQ